MDAVFYALVGDLAGAPQEIIDPHTGQVEGRVIQSLYGQRSWTGGVSGPLLFAGQFVDTESGWAYNRFRFYSPALGGFNAQDPLGLAPRIASAQGYVDHAAYWGRRTWADGARFTLHGRACKNLAWYPSWFTECCK